MFTNSTKCCKEANKILKHIGKLRAFTTIYYELLRDPFNTCIDR